MFKILSENILYIMIKNKLLDIESYDIYLYALEVILLNGSIFIICLLISIIAKELFHMLSFTLFFIPLRMLVGGYHCKNSELCFLCSISLYIISILLTHTLQEISIINFISQISFVISIIIILIFAPLTNSNHPLEYYQISRNKKILYKLVTIYFILYIVLYKYRVIIAFSENIFIILVAFILILGILKTPKLNF